MSQLASDLQKQEKAKRIVEGKELVEAKEAKDGKGGRGRSNQLPFDIIDGEENRDHETLNPENPFEGYESKQLTFADNDNLSFSSNMTPRYGALMSPMVGQRGIRKIDTRNIPMTFSDHHSKATQQESTGSSPNYHSGQEQVSEGRKRRDPFARTEGISEELSANEEESRQNDEVSNGNWNGEEEQQSSTHSKSNMKISPATSSRFRRNLSTIPESDLPGQIEGGLNDEDEAKSPPKEIATEPVELELPEPKSWLESTPTNQGTLDLDAFEKKEMTDELSSMSPVHRPVHIFRPGKSIF
jgi:hypothetical protein